MRDLDFPKNDFSDEFIEFLITDILKKYKVK